MNIKNAKEQIKNAVIAYTTKDVRGNYVIPIEKQRPIFMIGAPGIGKTAIMEQIASELGIGLLSYSMTHHTRQSAIGLPFITHKSYGGQEYDITEYTMSEIIASIYEVMENGGVTEGILFLDEINCVSETLTPLMLQFLQYKVFGKHRVPEGWIIVTAGNPPEYNESVREFDAVTLDRVKKIPVEPDLETWKEYAYQVGIHPAITTFLDIKRAYFYMVETTVEGQSIVTPRGWEDLSKMLQLYELKNIRVDKDLIIQYLQNEKVSEEFDVYYELFRKYKSDYQINEILAGKASKDIITSAQNAQFDERYSLVGMLLDSVGADIKAVIQEEKLLRTCVGILQQFRVSISKPGNSPAEKMSKIVGNENKNLAMGMASGSLSIEDRNLRQDLIEFLKELTISIQGEEDSDKSFKTVKKKYNNRVKGLSEAAGKVGIKLSNLFKFGEEAFGDGQEMVIIVTELTANYYSAKFISTYGCKEYFEHNKELLFYERQKEIIAEISELEEL